MEHLAPSNISEEIIARLKADAEKGLDHWHATTTPEHRAEGKAKHEEFKNNPEFAAQEMEVNNKMWADSDADNDGRLNLEEFKNFRAAGMERARAAGRVQEDRPNASEELYAILNDITPGQEGVVLAEYLGAMGHMMQHMVAYEQSKGR